MYIYQTHYSGSDKSVNTALPSAAVAELLLLRTYDVEMLSQEPLQAAPGVVDPMSTQILQPGMLTGHSPRYTVGDGSCLYRTTSLALYGTEQHDLLV